MLLLLLADPAARLIRFDRGGDQAGPRRAFARHALPLAFDRESEKLRRMEDRPRRPLLDLFAAGEPPGDDEGGWIGVPDRRQQGSLADRHRDPVVVAALEAERSGHPAAAAVGGVDLQAAGPEDRELGLEAEDRLVVAMAVDEGLAVEVGRSVAVAAGEELAERLRLGREAAGVIVAVEEVRRLVAKDRDARRLEADDRRPGPDLVAELREDGLQEMLRLSQVAPVVERPATAQRALRDDDLAAGRLEDLDRGLGNLRMEVVVERVDPEDHPVARRLAGSNRAGGRRAPTPRRSEALVGEPRDLALRRDAADGLEHPAQQRGMGDRVHQPRHPRREAGPPMDQAHRVRRPRSEPTGVVMRSELRLVRRHVDVDRALAFAALARQAQVERLFDVVVAPAAGHLSTVHQLEQQVGAAASRVALLAGDHVARAHHAAVVTPALPDPDAAERRVAERPVIVGEVKEGLRPWWRVVGPEPEIGQDRRRPDELAGVHPARRVPEILQLLERADDLLAEHHRQQLAARLAVAVLARERAAHADDEIGGFVHVAPERLQPGLGHEIEIDPAMEHALAEVAIHVGRVAVAVPELADGPEVVTKAVGRDA